MKTTKRQSFENHRARRLEKRAVFQILMKIFLLYSQ